MLIFTGGPHPPNNRKHLVEYSFVYNNSFFASYNIVRAAGADA
jgi:hypothetical protein